MVVLAVLVALAVVRLVAAGGADQNIPDRKGSEKGHADRKISSVELNGLRFTDVTFNAGLGERHSAENLYGDDSMSAGVAVADVFGSGRQDIFLPRIGRPNALYHNNGDGTFTDVAEQAGVAGEDPFNGSHAAAFADIDADGCMDLYVAPARAGRSTLYVNNCNGTFREEAATRGIDVTPGSPDFGAQEHGVTFGDFDLDGDLDLLVLHWDQGYLQGDDFRGAGKDGLCKWRWSPGAAGQRGAPPPGSLNRSRLYQNDGSGHFNDVTATVGLDFRGVLAFTGQFVDLNGDGWPELLMTGDYCTSRVYRNLGGVRFVDVTAEIGVGTDENGMGSVVADVDDDGRYDWFVTSVSHPSRSTGCNTLGPTGCSGNRLYHNRGDGTFEDATDRFGLRDGWWGWGAAIEDFDNDGDVEVVQTNGMTLAPAPRGASNDPFFKPFEKDPMRFWVRDGRRFVEVADKVGLADSATGVGLVPFDYDSDGDLDILVARSVTTPLLFRNDAPHDSNWLTVRLDDQTTPGNSRAEGARVVVVSGSRRQVKRIATDGSYESQKPAEVHVGLGDERDGVRVEVTWPGTQVVQAVDDVEPNQVLVVRRNEP
ncbi:MAG: CRTAC1 family protein [Propionibacteriaceae bacterium]|nr:CRTAC1 family protein [Propionibacteriaceae bacterium]